MTAPLPSTDPLAPRLWWKRRPYSRAEMVADGVIHGIGLAVAIIAGGILLYLAFAHTAQNEAGAIALYFGTLVTVLTVSLAYNLWPDSVWKSHLARLDQAAIFLFIAGTYTPFLAVLGDTPSASVLLSVVWAVALIGIALKLLVPERFGRLAIVLYLAIGWSGVTVFQSLATALPSSTLWLILAGGIAYSAGIIFHLWEKLLFQNALWHVFVVVGASLHLFAVIDCMVLARL